MLKTLAIYLLVFSCAYGGAYWWIAKSFEDSSIDVWNWCPLDVVKVEVLPYSRSFTQFGDLSRLCIVRVDERLKIDTKKFNFKMLMRARSQERHLAVLEIDETHGVFRQEGIVFKSKELGGFLENLKE